MNEEFEHINPRGIMKRLSGSTILVVIVLLLGCVRSVRKLN